MGDLPPWTYHPDMDPEEGGDMAIAQAAIDQLRALDIPGQLSDAYSEAEPKILRCAEGYTIQVEKLRVLMEELFENTAFSENLITVSRPFKEEAYGDSELSRLTKSRRQPVNPGRRNFSTRANFKSFYAKLKAAGIDYFAGDLIYGTATSDRTGASYVVKRYSSNASVLAITEPSNGIVTLEQYNADMDNKYHGKFDLLGNKSLYQQPRYSDVYTTFYYGNSITEPVSINNIAEEGVFFPSYTPLLQKAYERFSGRWSGTPAEYEELDRIGKIVFYFTMVNYMLELIVLQIQIAQNLNSSDLTRSNEFGESDPLGRILNMCASDYDDDGVLQYYSVDSLLPLYWGTYKADPEGGEGTEEIPIFFGGKVAAGEGNTSFALLNKNTKIINMALSYTGELSSLLDAEARKSYGINAINNFLSQIADPAKAAGKNMICIYDAWDEVTDLEDDLNSKADEIVGEIGTGDNLMRQLRKSRRANQERRRKDFRGTLQGLMYARNPEKLFFKEQCFLLSYIAQIAKHKKDKIDRPEGGPGSLGYVEPEEVEETADSPTEDVVTHRGESKKLIPYYGYGKELTEKYKSKEDYNATLLLDGDPYGFLNKLVSGDQSGLLNIDHRVLSLLQPFIRLYKVEIGRSGVEKDTEIKFDSYRTSREDKLFKTHKLRNTGVGLKSFNFTYDGSNPFGAKKSIKGTLKIFANTFDELMDNERGYRYVDLALKTLNTNNSKKIFRENENLAKLNFRLKAQVGWSVPDISVLDRLGLTTKKISALRAALFESIVTLNLTPTVHDFAFDEMGRVNFTINYLAYAEEVYSQAKFNVFSEAQFAANREDRNLKMKYYSKECKPEAVTEIKKAYAQEASGEIGESISHLVARLIDLDRIFYISITQDEVKTFISQGPFRQLDSMTVQDDDTHQASLQSTVDKALEKFVEQRGSDTPTPNEKGKVSTALATTNPESTVISFFYLSDLIDTILANIEREIQLIPEYLDDLRSGEAEEYDDDDIDSKIVEYRKYEKAFRKLRYVLGPVEFVNPADNGKSIFVNLGDIPVSVRYWFEWLTSTMLDKDKAFYSLTSFMNDFINRMIRQFLNSDGCFGYNIRQNVNMQQVTYTGPQVSSAIKSNAAGKDSNGYVIDPITKYCQIKNISRAHINNLNHPVLKGHVGPRLNIKGIDEVNYMIYFVGRTAPTEKMLGKRSEDEKMGIYHYQIGRDAGIVRDIQLTKTATPGLQEVRFEQQGYDGLEQLRVTYDASIKAYANPNTFPGTYLFVDPAGFSPSAKNSGIDLTKYGVGGYYMIVRSTHNFAPGEASTEISAKWVNSLHTDQSDEYTSQATFGQEERDKSNCTGAQRRAGVKEE